MEPGLSSLPIDSVHALAVTAHVTAAARARESARADALFTDPWAAHLVAEEGVAWLECLGAAAALWPVIRTRFLDDLLYAAPVPQVVLLAAGLDSRAYRFRWPAGTCLFEIDQARIMDYKDNVLGRLHARPHCRRIAVRADLRQPWASLLVAAGFDRARPAIWIVEGLLLYLDRAAAQYVMGTIAHLASPGSWLGLDLPRRSVRGHVVDDPGRWLHELGWEATVSTLADVAAHYGRWPFPHLSTPDQPRHGQVFFIAAHR